MSWTSTGIDWTSAATVKRSPGSVIMDCLYAAVGQRIAVLYGTPRWVELYASPWVLPHINPAWLTELPPEDTTWYVDTLYAHKARYIEALTRMSIPCFINPALYGAGWHDQDPSMLEEDSYYYTEASIKTVLGLSDFTSLWTTAGVVQSLPTAAWAYEQYRILNKLYIVFADTYPSSFAVESAQKTAYVSFSGSRYFNTMTGLNQLESGGEYSYTHTDSGYPVLSHPIPDVAVNEGSSSYDIDLSSMVSTAEGGSLTPLYVITAATGGHLVIPTISGSTLTLTFSAKGYGTATITVTAYDSIGRSAASTFTVTVNHVNHTPTLTQAITDKTFTVMGEDPVRVNLYEVFADADDDDTEMRFSVTGNTIEEAVHAYVDDSPGCLVLEPTNLDIGTGIVTVTAKDSAGGTGVSCSFNVYVAPTSTLTGVGVWSKTSSISSYTTQYNVPLCELLTVADTDNDDLVYGVISNDNPSIVSAAVVDNNTLRLTPVGGTQGRARLVLSVSNPESGGVTYVRHTVMVFPNTTTAPFHRLGTASTISDITLGRTKAIRRVYLRDVFYVTTGAVKFITYTLTSVSSTGSFPTGFSVSIDQVTGVLTIYKTGSPTTTATGTYKIKATYFDELVSSLAYIYSNNFTVTLTGFEQDPKTKTGQQYLSGSYAYESIGPSVEVKDPTLPTTIYGEDVTSLVSARESNPGMLTTDFPTRVTLSDTGAAALVLRVANGLGETRDYGWHAVMTLHSVNYTEADEYEDNLYDENTTPEVSYIEGVFANANWYEGTAYLTRKTGYFVDTNYRINLSGWPGLIGSTDAHDWGRIVQAYLGRMFIHLPAYTDVYVVPVESTDDAPPDGVETGHQYITTTLSYLESDPTWTAHFGKLYLMKPAVDAVPEVRTLTMSDESVSVPTRIPVVYPLFDGSRGYEQWWGYKSVGFSYVGCVRRHQFEMLTL